MKISYTKKCTLPKDLIPLLRNRGLSIPDEPRAISYLTNIGYFRLSAYLYPLLKEPKTDHRYKDGTTFEMALGMYRFDRKLRVLLFNEIEKIEVAIRSAMNNLVSDALNDVFWITEPKYIHFGYRPETHLLPYLHHQIPAVYRFAQQLVYAETEIAA
jgi:abortive infection bacteriophage resistance protein